MSDKRKKKKLKVTVGPSKAVEEVVGGLDNLTTKLILTQDKHLKWVESWTSKLPKLFGVCVPQSLTYDLIQVLNDLYLRNVLEKGKLDENPA